MGGCVASIMARASSGREVPDPIIEARRAYGPVATVCSPAENNMSSAIYRTANVSDAEHNKLCNEWYNGPNVVQRLQRTCDVKKEKKAIAYRSVKSVEKVRQNDSKGAEREWEVMHLNEPAYLTYGEFWSHAVLFGRGLAALGLVQRANIAIYEETRWEWLASAYGIWTQNMVIATVYANLGEAALLHALAETESAAIICGGKNLKTLLPLLKKAGLSSTHVIYLDSIPAGLDTEDMSVISWRSVLERGEKSEHEIWIPTDCDATALIMYTSGTVAAPKGVIHSFGSLNSGVAALHERFCELTGPQQDDETYVAYLPLAHILEFVCQIIFLDRGVLLCYGTPRTLTDAFTKPRGDLAEFQPMFFVGVPRIFETIRKAVLGRLAPGSIKRTIFDSAYESRLEAIKNARDTPYWNEKVFRLPRTAFGGKTRGIVCGGAPLGDKTQEFMNVVFGVPVAQGYGLTETCCCGTVQRTGELYPAAGQLLKSAEAKLLDTEEYKHTDKPHPRGELLLRGPFLFKGYYKQEKQTKEAIDKDGWFHTGDVMEIDDSGCQRVVGRVKALTKNVLGEYIAMEVLEALYGQHPLVGNGVCVLVHPQRAYICALVLTDEQKAKEFAQINKIHGVWPTVLDNPVFHQMATESLAELAKKEGRRPFEFLRNVRVLAEDWTPENGLVTASMKIKRSAVDERYASTIAELFLED